MSGLPTETNEIKSDQWHGCKLKQCNKVSRGVQLTKRSAGGMAASRGGQLTKRPAGGMAASRGGQLTKRPAGAMAASR